MLQDSLRYPVNVYSFITAVTLKHTSLAGPTTNPTQKVTIQTSLQHHLTKQQCHFGRSEEHQSSMLIFEARRGISLALREYKSNSWISHFRSLIHKRVPIGKCRQLQVSAIIS